MIFIIEKNGEKSIQISLLIPTSQVYELVQDSMMSRGRANFVSDEAHFADVAGSYGEKMQRSIKQNLPLVGH